VLDRCRVADGGMPALRVVEVLDVVGDRVVRLGPRCEDDTVHELFLQRGEEALGDCVVVAVADPTRAPPDADSHREELVLLSDENPGTWLAYLARDIVANGKKNGGVERKYRPRGYDEGPSD